MATISVAEAFEQVLRTLEPTAEDLAEVERLRALVRGAVEGVREDVLVGPLARGTATRHAISAIEILVLDPGHLAASPRRAPSHYVNKLRRALRNDLAAENVSITEDGRGLLLVRDRSRLWIWPTFEGAIQGEYLVPSLHDDEWKKVDFSAHRSAGDVADALADGWFKALVKVLRSWCQQANQPSFALLLESSAWQLFHQRPSSLAEGLRDLFAHLANAVLQVVPGNAGAFADEGVTPDERLSLSIALLYAAQRATLAVDHERAGRIDAAHDIWRSLLGEVWPLSVPGPTALPPQDVLREVRAEGLRTLEKVRLTLDGLTVLIGENGAGKSSLIEACELLRRASTPSFLQDLNAIHGGLRLLLRHGGRQMVLGVTIEGAGPPLDYEIVVVQSGYEAAIGAERLVLGDRTDPERSLVLLERASRGARVHDGSAMQPVPLPPAGLALTSFGLAPPNQGIRRMIAALDAIDVHVPFEVTPSWVAQAHDRRSLLRSATLIQNATRLERLGVNLPNAFHALRSDFGELHWAETMDYVRLGLGERIESVNTRADAAGGSIALRLKLRGRDVQIPSAALSEGTLAYLAFVAMVRLNPARSLLAFDEPELHLHPRLLVRVMGFLQSLSQRCPVLLASHSRRLLDELREPARSAVLCELTDEHTTRLRRPDAAVLKEWLEDYEGLGKLLDAGYEPEVMGPPEDA